MRPRRGRRRPAPGSPPPPRDRVCRSRRASSRGRCPYVAHRQIQHPVDLVRLVDRDDIRVIQGRRQLALRAGTAPGTEYQPRGRNSSASTRRSASTADRSPDRRPTCHPDREHARSDTQQAPSRYAGQPIPSPTWREPTTRPTLTATPRLEDAAWPRSRSLAASSCRGRRGWLCWRVSPLTPSDLLTAPKSDLNALHEPRRVRLDANHLPPTRRQRPGRRSGWRRRPRPTRW